MSNTHSPKHYTQGYIEAIYAIHQVLGDVGFKAFCMGNYLKYKMRHEHKNGAEDLQKAQTYLNWAVNGLPAPVNGMLPKDMSTEQCANAPQVVNEEKDVSLERIKERLHGILSSKLGKGLTVEGLVIKRNPTFRECVDIHCLIIDSILDVRYPVNVYRVSMFARYAEMAEIVLNAHNESK